MAKRKTLGQIAYEAVHDPGCWEWFAQHANETRELWERSAAAVERETIVRLLEKVYGESPPDELLETVASLTFQKHKQPSKAMIEHAKALQPLAKACLKRAAKRKGAKGGK